MRLLSFLFSILWHGLIIGLLFYYPLHHPYVNLKKEHIYEVELIKLAPRKIKTVSRNTKKIEIHNRNIYPKKPAFVRNVSPPVQRREPIPIPTPSIEAKKRRVVKKRPSSFPTPAQIKRSILARALRDVSQEAEKETDSQKIVEEEIKKLKKEQINTSSSMVAGYNIELYSKIVEQKIKQNWRYPAISGLSLKATVDILVSKDGKISSYKIVKGSGKEDFDNSVIKSILETKVLPPPPQGRGVKIIISFSSENNS